MTEEKVYLIRSYLFFWETKDLWKKISGLSYALIKGEALSIMAYNQTGRRLYGDIDVLIDRANVGELEKICEEEGFCTQHQSRRERIYYLSGSHQIYPYMKRGKYINIVIDINFDVFWGEYSGKRIKISDFLADTKEIEIYGNKIKTLAPLKMMIQLVLHHYREMNSIYHLAGHNSIRADIFRDIYALWKNNQKEISIEQLYKAGSEYEIIPYIFYILYYTNVLFKDEALEKYVHAFETSAGRALLNSYGLDEQEKRQWKVGFLERLESNDLYGLIKDELTEQDNEKIKRELEMFS